MAESKKIYLGAALAHAPEDYLRTITELREMLGRNFEVLEFYGLHKEGPASAVYEHDIECVKTCDIMLAECSQPSTGLGFEIASALNFGKQVIAVAKNGTNVSRMIEGINHPLFTFHRYSDLTEIIKLL